MRWQVRGHSGGRSGTGDPSEIGGRTEVGVGSGVGGGSGTGGRGRAAGTPGRWLGRRLAVLLLVAGSLPLAAVTTRCTPRPHILEPGNETQIAATGTPVEIDLVKAPPAGARLQVLLQRAIDEKPVSMIDVTDRLTLSGSLLTGQLGPAELRPGRNVLIAGIDVDDDGVIDQESFVTFSWEPDVDVSDADRCDPLDRTRCMYPFPNDYFTIDDSTAPTGRRVHIAPDATPTNYAGVHVDPTRWNRLDGFSVGPMILFQVPDLDLAQTGAAPVTDIGRSLDPDAPIVLADADTGTHQLIWVERDATGTSAADEPLIIRVGRNLPNAHHYVVALRHLRNAEGDPIPVPRLFQIYRDRIPTYLPAVEARRARMEQVFEAAERAGIPRDQLWLAWDFTTQSVQSLAGNLLHMRDDAFARLGSAAPTFTVDSVSEPTLAQDARKLRDIRGTFQVPLYMTGGGAPGSFLRFGADGLPENDGDFFTATYRCIIPRAVATDGASPVYPARPSLYGHGLLGSEDEVSAGNVEDMANEHDFVFCATRWYGMEENDQGNALNILADFSLFPSLSDRLHQGMLAQLFLGRLMIHPQGLVSDPAFQVAGEPVIDRSELFYDGNSQGAIAGGALAAVAQDFTRAVLGVAGMNYSTLLDRSRDFDTFNQFFRINYQDNPNRKLLISMAEMLWEAVETSGHALHITSDPYPNTPAKKILMHVAFGDFQVANVAAEVEARSIGAHLRLPALDPAKMVPDVTPYYGIPPIASYPFDGSAIVIWDSGDPPAPTTNTAPPSITSSDPAWAQLMACPRNYSGDPHECPRRQPEARLQKSEFLKDGGAVIDTCGGVPCLAPTP
jgi:hypothetical protein